MKFALISVLAQLLILANGRNISLPFEIGKDIAQEQDAELKYRILKEEFNEQLQSLKIEMNLRTSALYKIVTNIEQTLLKQGLKIEQVTKDPADFYGQSEDSLSKLFSLERKVEKEVTSMRTHDARLVQRLNVLESDIKANSYNSGTRVLSVDTMATKNDNILQAVETLKNEIVSLKSENLALNNKINKIRKDQILTQTKSSCLRTSEILFANDKSMNSSIAIMNKTLAQLKIWCFKENNNQKQKRSTDPVVLSNDELTKLKSLVQQLRNPSAWFRDIQNTLRVLNRKMFQLSRDLTFASSEIDILKLNISQLTNESYFGLNGVKANVTKNEQNVWYLTSLCRKVQEDLLSVQNLSSVIWHQCNETKERVVRVSELATVLNISLTTHQEDVFLNLTLQENRLNKTVAEKFHLITTNISNVKNTSDHIQNSLHSIESKIQQNTQDILNSQSELFNLALEHNNIKAQIADAKTKQLIMESQMLLTSTYVNESRLAVNKSVDECKTFTRTHVRELKVQIKSIYKNLTEYENDLDSSIFSLQNLTQDIAGLQDFQKHTAKRYSNFEGNVSAILQTTKTFETDIAKLRRSLNDLNTNATSNQLTVQSLESTSVKLREDLSSTQSLSSIIWDQCNKTKQQLVNISKTVTEMRISNKGRQEVQEQKILAMQENASSFRASLTNGTKNVDELKRGIQRLQQTVFNNLTQQNIRIDTMVEEKLKLLVTNISNMKNSSDRVQWLLHALQSNIQQNKQNITMCHTEIFKLASEQNKTNVQLIDAKNIQRTIQSNLSRILTSVDGFQLAVNHSVNECNKFTKNYVHALEKNIQIIENNFSEFQGDLNEVMLSQQNYSNEISSLCKSEQLHGERFAKLQRNLSVIANTTKHFEIVLSNLSVLNDVITNVTFNTENIQELRSSSITLQHNLSSFHALSSAIWRQCNSTEEWIQNISSIVRTNSLVEKEILKLQYNVTTLAANLELVSNETRSDLDEQAQRLLDVSSKLEKNTIQMTNTSDDLKQTLRNSQLFMTSLINNVSNHEGRLVQMSAALNRSTEIINSVKHNITSLSDRIQNVSTVAVSTTTESTSQSLVRLVGGSSDREGRVEVFHGGFWGTVCDDSWDSADATVVCRMLGYTGSASAFEQARFGSGTGKIMLDEVRCSGMESSIFSCPHNGIELHDCGHAEDAAVSCS